MSQSERTQQATSGRRLVFTMASLLTCSVLQSNAGSAQSGLAVQSDPSGAIVYLDGRLVGTTPLEIPGVASGDHGVRIVKDGFLENRRAVVVGGSKSRLVQVRLTPQGRAGAVRRQTDADVVVVDKGGSRSKLLWIAAPLVVGGGVAAYLIVTKNDPPVAGTVAVSPQTALMAATEVRFTSQGASDPNNDSLTYTWDFGDGSSGAGQAVSHVYRTAGAFTAKLTVSDGKKSATATAGVTVKSMQGTWTGVFNGSNLLTFTLTQTELNLTGTYDHIWANSNYSTVGEKIDSGRINPPSEVVLSTSIPSYYLGSYAATYYMNYTCTLDAELRTCSGTTSGMYNYPFTLTRQ
jgi:hypothetical protein